MPAVFRNVNGSVTLSNKVITDFAKKFACHSPFFSLVDLDVQLLNNRSTFTFHMKAKNRDNIISETNAYIKLLSNSISTNLGLNNCIVIIHVCEENN